MPSLFWSIFEVASNAIDVTLIVYLLNGKLHRGWKDWNKDALFIIFTTALLTHVNNIGMPFAQSLLLLLVVEEAYALCFKPGSLFHRLLWPLAAHIVFIGGNLLVILLLIYAPGYHLADIGGQTGTRIMVVVLYALLTGLAISLLSRVKASDREAPRWLQAGMVAMGSVSVAYAGYSYDYVIINAFENPDEATLLFQFAFLYFLLSACCLLLFDQVSSWMVRAFDAEVEQAQAIEQQRSLENLSASYANLRAFRHDMNSQLSILLQYATNGQIDQLLLHLQELNGDFVPLRNVAFSGHFLLDALLTTKRHQAEENNVNLQIDLSVPKTLSIRDVDFCSTISNLLDNALEAVSALPPEERSILLAIHVRNQSLVILVENGTKGAYRRRADGVFLTTKANDPEYHGIGLRRVHSLVESMGGNVAVEAKANLFSVYIILPLQEGQV